MAIDINLFDQSVRHLYAYGVPVAVKKVDKRRIMIFVEDKPAIINAKELMNTVVDVMRD